MTLEERVATHHLVQALSITQSEHTTKFERLEQKVDRIETGVGQILVLLQELTRRDQEPGQ